MQIAHIEGIHLAIPSRYDGPQPHGAAQWPRVEMLLVRVETDTGIVGWGEAFGHLGAATTRAALDTLVAPLCVGADAGDPGGLQQRIRRELAAYGRGGAVLFALSGIDIALWDIRGKAAGLPVHRLLGGSSAAPASVTAYASLLRYGAADLVGAAVREAVARGYRSVKLHEATEETVAAARAAAGAGIGLMLDVNGRWSHDEVIALARRVEPYSLDWLEDPSWPADSAMLRRLAKETGTPLAAGENASSLAELARLAESGVTVIQPSVAKLGGLTAMVAAADLARSHGIRLAPHSAYFGPGLAATIHVCAALGASCEWYNCLLAANPCGIAPSNGTLTVPQGAGLGIDVDAAIVARYRQPQARPEQN